MSAITKLFGTHSERELKRIYPIVDKVESYQSAMQALSDEELKGKTKEFKERIEIAFIININKFLRLRKFCKVTLFKDLHKIITF